MIGTLVHFINTHLIPLGSIGVFAAAVIEEVIAPIPSALVILISGFILVSGTIDLHSLGLLVTKVAIPAAFGITVGSFLAYGLAYYLGKPFLMKFGKWFGLSWEDITKLQKRFENSSSDELSLFVVRAIPFVPSVVISAFCGLIRFPIRAYTIYSLLGLVIRTTILGFVGWQAGKFYFRYAKTIDAFENVILLAAVALVVLFFVWKYFRARKKEAALDASSTIPPTSTSEIQK